MKFLKKYIPFFITFSVITLIWYLTIFLTEDYFNADGTVEFGFPLVYYKHGNMCIDCDNYFSNSYLIFDVAFLFLFPFSVQKIWELLIKKKVNKI